MFLSRVSITQLLLLLAIVLLVQSGDAYDITLESIDPPPAQCIPSTFRWSGGVPPFLVNLFQQGGQGQRHLGPTNDSFFLWDSDFPTGTILTAQISDHHNSKSKETHPLTMLSGTNTLCLGILLSTTSSLYDAPTETAPGSTKTVTETLAPSTSILLSSPPSIPAAPPQRSNPTRGAINTPRSSGTDSKIQAASSPHPSVSSTVMFGVSSTALSVPLATEMAGGDTMAPAVPPHSDTATVSNPSPSTLSKQSASPIASNSGRLLGIIIGCLVTALVAAIALSCLQKYRRARERVRITSMTTLDTLAFTGMSSISVSA